MKLCGRMLRVCWSGILSILSSQFGAKSNLNIGESIASLLASKDETALRQIISTSLDGLCTAAQLACTLGKMFAMFYYKYLSRYVNLRIKGMD